MAIRSQLSSLQSRAARSEADFTAALLELTEAGPSELGAFFGKINIPRTLKDSTEELVDDVDPLVLIGDYVPVVTDFAAEIAIGEHFNEFHVRHLRKLQWHSSKPDPQGIPNVRRLYRAIVAAVHVRLLRVSSLLSNRDEMTPGEWGQARGLVNKAMGDFREATEVVCGRFVPSIATAVEAEALADVLEPVRATLSKAAESVDGMRVGFEARRQAIAVLPPGHAPVRPAPYFPGDVMEQATWTRFRSQIHDNLHSITTVLNHALLVS